MQLELQLTTTSVTLLCDLCSLPLDGSAQHKAGIDACTQGRTHNVANENLIIHHRQAALINSFPQM